jgi:hypothetical protein
MIEAPLSEDLEYSSDYLDEFHGRDAFFDFNDDYDHDRLDFNVEPINVNM